MKKATLMIVRQITFAIVGTGVLFLVVKIIKNFDFWVEILQVIGVCLLGACLLIALHYFTFVLKIKRLPKDIQERIWRTHYIKIFGMATVISAAVMLVGDFWAGLYITVYLFLHTLREGVIYRNYCREQLR